MKNNGNTASHGVQAAVRDGQNQYVNTTLEDVILPGQEKEIEITLPLPDQAVKTVYTVELTPAGGAGSTASADITVGESYYRIEKNSYCINGKRMLVASVRNIGFEPGSGTLEIYDVSGNQKVYETFDIDGLEYGKVLYYSTSIESLDWDSFSTKTIGMRVVENGEAKGDSRTVTIFQDKETPLTGVAVDQTYVYLEKAGNTQQLNAVIKPAEADVTELVWESSNAQVASVSQSGLVTAKKPGQAIIKVSTMNGSYYGQCAVTVGGEDPSGPDNPDPDNPDPDNPNPVNMSYKDVGNGDWYYDYVYYVFSKGLMTGLNEEYFGPSQTLARAQFAVILYRMNNSPAVTYTAKFPDVAEGIWYTDAILWASGTGVVTGYTSTGMFGPGDNINREQMAVMMYRYANYMGYDVSEKADFSKFKDASKVSAYAQEAMSWAVGIGIITGKDNGTAIDPQGNANRAECATIIMRFRNKYQD